MQVPSEVFAALDSLVDGWCERRALRPLRLLLPAYPMASTLTDAWMDLHSALRDVRAFARDDLGAEEPATVEDAIFAVGQALRR